MSETFHCPACGFHFRQHDREQARECILRMETALMKIKDLIGQ